MTDVTHREEIVTNAATRPQISWGALFAGLVVLLGTSWLLSLLGMAIGAGVADSYGSTLIGEGLSQSAAVWMLLSTLIAFFVGSMAAARLAGTSDDASGMMHGFTLWGLGTTVFMILGYYGVTGLLQTGQAAVSAAASATSAVAAATGNGTSAWPSPLAARLR